MRYPIPNRNRFRISSVSFHCQAAVFSSAVRDGLPRAMRALVILRHSAYSVKRVSIRLSIVLFPRMRCAKRHVRVHVIASGSRETTSILFALAHRQVAHDLVHNHCIGPFCWWQYVHDHLTIADNKFTLAVLLQAGQHGLLAVGSCAKFAKRDLHRFKRWERVLPNRAPPLRKNIPQTSPFALSENWGVFDLPGCPARRFQKVCRLFPVPVAKCATGDLVPSANCRVRMQCQQGDFFRCRAAHCQIALVLLRAIVAVASRKALWVCKYPAAD